MSAAVALVDEHGEVTPIGDRDAYERVCRALLRESDFQQIGARRFKKRSAWRILANHYGVSSELVDRQYEREGRTIVRAEVVDRATADGRTMDGLGACDIFERCCKPNCWKAERFDDHTCCPADCPGTVHFSHAGHDIPATAHTRARNRAVADLIGFGEISAEELAGDGEEVPVVAVPDPVGEPSDTNPWLDVLGAPHEWEDLRFTKRAKTWPDFRALRSNPRWGTAGTHRGKPAPMALWLDGAEPEGFIEVLAQRDQGLPVDLELLDLEAMQVERTRPERQLDDWTKAELAEALERDHEVTFSANQLARTKKPMLVEQLRALQAAAAAEVSAGEALDVAAAEGPLDGASVSPASSMDVASPADDRDDAIRCDICGSADSLTLTGPGSARCTDTHACMGRVAEKADEAIEAGS